ncbi:hypothetical protein HNQ62_003012 [Sulfurisphaera ohwakuensis]|uniref:Uncharacterized protein n=1 Tax=Sulfurisphaera ohwakuensis TaxID=69656 RepID=A0A7J9RW50_SULOH|nr:hypothetical protein [Sulfurisphaera ohwakuensis]
MDEIVKLKGDEIRDLIYYVAEKDLDPADAYLVVFKQEV